LPTLCDIRRPDRGNRWLGVRLVLVGEQAEENADIVRRVQDRLALQSCGTAPEAAGLATMQGALGQGSTTGDSDCHLVLRKSLAADVFAA